MDKKIVLTPRDYMLFEDICRFGFTSTDHFTLRFASNFKQASRRFVKLSNHKYLRPVGRSIDSSKKLYIPERNFYRVCPFKEVYRFNVNNLAHDEYILKLYSIIKKHFLVDNIVLEQDIKKHDGSASYLRIPDLIVKSENENFIFEYERTIKSDMLYKKINEAYRAEDGNNKFCFLCKNKAIEEKIKHLIKLDGIKIINSDLFFLSLKRSKNRDFSEFMKTLKGAI